MMRIGFYTRYRQRESTWLTLQLADYCQRFGTVTVRTDDPVRPLCAAWDDKVSRTSKLRFTDWARQLDYLVWSFSGLSTQVSWASTHGCVPYALVVTADWRDRKQRARARLHAYHTAFCPQQMMLPLQRWAPKAALSPVRWSPQLPLTRKVLDIQQLRVVVPLIHGSGEYVSSHLWQSLHTLMQQHKTAAVVILTDLDHRKICHRIAGLRERYPDRIRAVQTLTPEQVMAEMEHAAVTWMPTWTSDVGLPALWSIYCGTPVLAFDVGPINQCIQQDQTGWLVSNDYAPVVSTGFHTLPLYGRMTEQLLALLHRPQRIRDVTARMSDGLSNRCTVFNKVWEAAFRIRKAGG